MFGIIKFKPTILTIMIIKIPDLATDPNQGLEILGTNDLTPSIRELIYQARINRFKTSIPNQPPFFIDRESWELLSQGKGKDSLGNIKLWLPSGYSVYAILFCLAFDEPTFVAAHLPKFGYFRVRTILVKDEEVAIGGNINVHVEEENIAYADLNTAFTNVRNLTQENCLKFLLKSDILSKPTYDKVQREVPLKSNPGSVSLLPTVFIDFVDNKKKSKITNEGNYFGKDRIMSLLDRYRDQNKGSLISLAQIGGSKPKVTFHFKINLTAAPTLPCPEPTVCK